MDYTKRLKLFTWTDLFYKPIGIAVLFAIALLLCGVICYGGPISGIAIISLLVGLPLVTAIVVYPRFGIMVLIVSAFIIMWIFHMLYQYPIGVVMDALQLLLVLGFILKHKYDRSWAFANNKIGLFILIWVLYNILEVANPEAQSKLAWLYTIRSVAIITLTYYLFVYYIRSVEFIRLIIKTWLALTVFAAIYSIIQEHHGFFGFEKAYMASEPHTLQLYFIAGRWRRFGIFADPVQAAYNMVLSTLICVAMLFFTKALWKKMVLIFMMVLFITATLYTGIRGAFVLLPASLVMLFLLKLTKKTLLVGIMTGMVFVFLVEVPTSNVLLYRFQTAFRPQYDPSFNVRKNNQKMIQPFIQAHPLGGGLGATGTWGRRFSPNSFLASFPPDSGYIRVAVETGWIGLLILCALLFVVLQTGINNYFLIQNSELKHYCLAMVLIVFALSIGNYPQEALVQFPINIYLYLAFALIHVTLKLDQKMRAQDTKTSKLLNT